MNEINKNDIITALATPYGKSAVAVIRLSGNGCIEKAERFLSRELENGKITVCTFKEGEFTEKLMAVCYKAPKSYTGEDTVELFPHGNMTIADKIIKVLTENGVRLAGRGEFTRRAFLNGKIDLMQCEALADIIDAQTFEQLYYGNKRYNGGFKALESVEKSLVKALSAIEAVLHYGDELVGEEVDSGLTDAIRREIEECISLLGSEIDGFAGGRIINDGFKITVIGAPNVGKSTILNALTGMDRAIVTDIAGTTRDTIDAEYIFNDRKFVITDTAGIRSGVSDCVEKIGIERALKAVESADAAVYVLTEGENFPIKIKKELSVTVMNKCDGEKEVGKDYRSAEKDGILRISARNGINITALKQKLYDLCPKDHGAICNHRQFECAARCLESLKNAENELVKADGLEIVAALLYDAYSAITEMYGEQADENIISAVFERFCVGK